jgi:hypothetical protein
LKIKPPELEEELRLAMLGFVLAKVGNALICHKKFFILRFGLPRITLIYTNLQPFLVQIRAIRGKKTFCGKTQPLSDYL